MGARVSAFVFTDAKSKKFGGFFFGGVGVGGVEAGLGVAREGG